MLEIGWRPSCSLLRVRGMRLRRFLDTASGDRRPIWTLRIVRTVGTTPLVQCAAAGANYELPFVYWRLFQVRIRVQAHRSSHFPRGLAVLAHLGHLGHQVQQIGAQMGSSSMASFARDGGHSKSPEPSI